MNTHDGTVRIIAVAGPPGSGKSTLCDALAQRLGDAVVVPMDHYQRMTSLPIEAVERWLERGADHDELPVPHLAEHLALLKAGQPVIDPRTGRTVAPRAHIVFETHFGRAHAGTGAYIDALVWLDTPLDVALLRNLRSFLQPLLQPGLAADALREELRWIDQYLVNHDAVVRRLLQLQAARVRAGADLVLAGGHAQDMVDEVMAWLAGRPV